MDCEVLYTQVVVILIIYIKNIINSLLISILSIPLRIVFHLIS